MARIDSTIEVDVPVQTVYNQWTQFEEFPRFMEGVREVAQLSDERLHWIAEIGGETKEWFARITRQVPDQVISWESEGGVKNDGTVVFRPVDANRTEIELHIDFEPEGLMEQTGSALGVVSRRVEGDLERFKEFIETRGRETGAWRGEIEHGQTRGEGMGGTGMGGETGTGRGTGMGGETGMGGHEGAPGSGERPL